MKRALILFNPISGKGRSRSIAEGAAASLKSRGLEVELFQSDEFTAIDQGLNIMRQAGLVVIAGGDGTLMRHLESLTAVPAAVYMLSAGNESLFAKEFQMSADPAQLLNALDANRIEHHFVPAINGKLFFTMVSIGLDSAVVDRVSRSRTGTISHWDYIPPTLATFMRYRAPKLTASADGVKVVDGECGYLIVANTKQYALGIDYVPEADSARRELSARFFPCTGVLQFLRWPLSRLFRREFSPAVRFFQGDKFEIDVMGETVPAPYPVQADGELAASTPIVIESTERTIRVLRGAA